MRGRRLTIDFSRRCIEIVSSRNAPRLRGAWTTIRGELKFGHLVVIRGRIRNVDINIMIDTGSDTSLANLALRDALRARVRTDRAAVDYSRAYTAGEPIVLDSAIVVPNIQMGGIDISDTVAFVGDFHIFDLWGLMHEPTILIGMDVISTSRAIAIDYGRSTVHFRLRRFGITSDATGGGRAE